MWRISSLFLTMVSLVGLNLAVQAQYGNEWINFNQQFYKIKIAEDGLYRVTAQELSAAGVPVNTISKDRYQLFRRGQEVALYVHDANGDQVIEYIEFYGERNDGRMDTELYVSEDAQPHAYYSLFSDSASYFLTWKITSQSTGKRMQVSTDRTSGIAAAAYHIRDSLNLSVSHYAAGPLYGPGNEIRSAIYDYGEGWTGSAFGKNQFRTFSFFLTEIEQDYLKPKLSVLLTGGNNLKHLVDVSVGPDQNSLRSVGQASFERQFNYLFTSEVEWSDVSSSGILVVKITALGLEGQSERVSVSYVKCDFPQAFSFPSSADQRHFLLDQKTQARGSMVLPTTQGNTLRVLDVTYPAAPVRLSSTVESDRIETVYATSGELRKLLVVKKTKPIGSIQKVAMERINPSTADYLIISHPDLNAEVDGVRPVSAYGAYRASAEGGGYKVLIADIENVYDQFGYGDPSPLAIRKYLKYAISIGDPRFLFLIGKGTSADFGYYRKEPSETELIHFVPTYGHPGSDLLFSVVNQGEVIPAIPTGRLNAFEAKDVKAYLDKVKTMEALPYDALWRKNLVQLSGGKTAFERGIFANYIRQFEKMAEGHFLGGKATNIHKENNSAIQVINIASEVNNGVGLITFFGHSGSAGTDLEIGKVSNPNQGYSNPGKYPVFLVNGCNAGEIFGANVAADQISFGEDWIKTPGKGALAFIANSDFALSSNLKSYSELFFKVAFREKDHFGSSVGEILQEVGTRYLNAANTDVTDVSQVYQTVLQGDPAVVVFGAEKPDFHILSGDVYASSFDGSRILANSDSFLINIIVKNYGKTTPDSLNVKVERTLPEGDIMVYEQTFPSVLRHDTLEFKITNDRQKMNEGNNVFLVSIDPDKEIPELQENNNTISYELFLNKGSTIHLFPIAMAAINDPQVQLMWQSSNLLETHRGYSLEVDTLPSFSSPFRSSVTVDGKLLLSRTMDLSMLPDSATVYWRTRYAHPKDKEDTSWVMTSFTLISAGTGGWGQFDGYQIEENRLSKVQYDPVSKQMQFQETASPLVITTHGPESGLGYDDYQVLIDGVDFLTTDNVTDPDCKRKDAINAVFFDRESALPYRPVTFASSDVFNDMICGRTPQMIYNLSHSEVMNNERRYLDSLIGQMKERDMVLFFSFGEVAYSEWDERIKASLRSVGVRTSTIENLTDGQPVIFLGRKGDAEGTAREITSDNSGISVKAQVLELLDLATGKFSSGSLTTPRIGPARTWGSFSYSIDVQENDDFAFDVYGITPAGDEQSVFSGSRISEIDISNIDASQFPFLKIGMSFSDTKDQTPPRLRNLAVSYQLPPEGLLASAGTTTRSVQEGQEFERKFSFLNLTQISFDDSLSVNYAVTSIASGNREVHSFKIKAPEPGDTTRFSAPVKTRGKVGKNNLTVSVESAERELYLQNNTIIINEAFTVEADKTNPVLDVTFDGGYILDGDIVSPTPNILIRFKDDNQYLHKGDTSGIQIELKRPCESCSYERVRFSSPKVTYTPAAEDQDFEIHYGPGPLEDGLYALRVQGTDESGNASGEYPYEINFEVINESSITHFYPYPNPFSTSAKFVFTLTGSVIPSELKIQIMTITGRVVREITQDEIGPLRIGNNITQYAWDGRDEYGDLLANGVYLYKVFIKEDGTEIKHRHTNADRGFKHGFGKLYILR